MTHQEFNELLHAIFNDLSAIGSTKGKEYTQGDDRLDNFKRIGKTLDITPEKVWAVYYNKHHDAIMRYIMQGETLSEPIQGRILDAINYLCLLMGLVNERGNK